MTPQTLPQFLHHRAQTMPETVAYRHKRLGVWKEFTWRESYDRVLDIAAGFMQAGLSQGDTVVIVGDNEPEAYFSELAALCIRAKTVCLYPDISPAELEVICTDAVARIVVAQDQEQVDKCLALPERLDLLRIVYWDETGMWGYDRPNLLPLQQLARHGATSAERARIPDLIAQASRDEIAMLSYTSGTTGKPKGVVFSHRLMLDNVWRVRESLGIRPADEYLSYIPLAWGTEQTFGLAMGLCCPTVTNFPEGPDQVPANLRELAVNFIFLGARQWEGLARDVHKNLQDTSHWRRRFVYRSLDVAARLADRAEVGRLGIWSRLLSAWIDLTVLKGIRDGLGLTRARVALMGGSTMAPEAFRFFHAIGVPLRSIYGASEIGLVFAHQIGHPIDPETLGQQLQCDPSFGDPLEIRLEEDGQLLVRGASGFLGYWNAPDVTQERVKDGWFETGDILARGRTGEYVYIDRKKDMRKLRTGAGFSPQYIEARLRFSKYIRDVLTIGDDRRDDIVALINIDDASLARWAEANRIAFSGFVELSQHPKVLDLIVEEVRQINAAAPASMQVRKIANFPKDLDPDEGELTRTRKLKRDVVEARYATLIEAIYAGETACRVAIEYELQDGRRGKTSADVQIREV